MTLAVEGSNFATNRAASISASVTTSGTNRILLFIFSNEGAGSAASTITGITTTGLTWAKLAGPSAWGLQHGSSEVWWAYAPTAGTYAAAVALSASQDDYYYTILAVSGTVNFSNPFDPNVGFPVFTHFDSNATSPVTGTFSTTKSSTIVFCFMGANTFSKQNAPPTGFTTDTDDANFNAAEPNGQYVGHQVYSSVQTGVTVTLPVNTANWGFFLFALTDQAAAAPVHPAALMCGV